MSSVTNLHRPPLFLYVYTQLEHINLDCIYHNSQLISLILWYSQSCDTSADYDGRLLSDTDADELFHDRPTGRSRCIFRLCGYWMPRLSFVTTTVLVYTGVKWEQQ